MKWMFVNVVMNERICWMSSGDGMDRGLDGKGGEFRRGGVKQCSSNGCCI